MKLLLIFFLTLTISFAALNKEDIKNIMEYKIEKTMSILNDKTLSKKEISDIIFKTIETMVLV